MVDSLTKGLWLPGGDVPDGELVAARPSLFDSGLFTWPVMVARRSAVEANIATMAAYCERHGVELAPHGKTTMAPTLFAAQLAAGAWGITVATAHQALAARRFGVPRVLLANEVLDPAVLRWAAGEAAAGWEFVCYVDSEAGVDVLREALRGLSTPGRGLVGILIEVGYPGGRTGCRDVAAAARLAAQVSDVDGAAVVGVTGFEGMLPDASAARSFLDTVVQAAGGVAPSCPAPLVLSAGGSRYFDAVVAAFVPPARANGWRVRLRSGAYVTHDHGLYAEDSPFARDPAEGTLVGALEVWAQVLSTPEPGLAILGAGKRDLPHDIGPAVVLGVRGVDGSPRATVPTLVEHLNDQHAYVHAVDMVPGELVRLGISHPCTAFDKWRVVPVVDDEYRVVDLLHTYF